MLIVKHVFSAKRMHLLIKLACSLICALLLCKFSYASIENVRFERFYVEQGLSQQSVTAIYQDSKGYMWFGTQEGLNRYDGRKFTSFTQSFDDPNAIINSFISSITEDAQGHIWVGSRGGVSRFNPVTSTFVNFTSDGSDTSINDSVVRKVWRDHQGTIWVTTRKGINKYLPSVERFKPFNLTGSDGKDADIFAIAEDITGGLWLASDRNGVYRFDPSNETFTHVIKEFTANGVTKKDNIRALYIDSQQQLWIGTAGLGAHVLDLTKPRAKNLNSLLTEFVPLRGLSIRDIYQDNLGVLWFGTDQGLHYADKSGNTGVFNHQKEEVFSLSDTTVLSIMKDNSDVLWIGTFKGLNKWNTATTQFDHYYVNSDKQKSLTGNNITALAQISEQSVWIASLSGLDILDLSTGNITPLALPQKNDIPKSRNRVMSIAGTSSDTVYLGTRGAGLYSYNLETKTFKNYTVDRASDNPYEGLQVNGITAIYPENEKTVWIATYGGGLSKLDVPSDTIKTYRFDSDDIYSLSSDRVMSITQARDGRLWLGSWDGGLSIFNPQTESAFRIRVDRDDKTGLSSNLVWSVLEDKDGNFWIGTQGGGIHLLRKSDLDKADIKFTRLTRANGMTSNAVFGALQDENGYVWASSNKGLSKIDPNTLEMTTFTYAQGLQSDEFNSGSYLKLHDGKMLFGGPNGVSAFYPKDITLNANKPKTVISTFQRLDKYSDINAVVNEENNIVVDYSDYLIGFEFAALHYVAPEKNLYRYRLQGFEDEWVDVKDVPRATYTNLPAGEYRFEVISANSDGVWNMEPAYVDLRVTPAPWASMYAYAVYTLLAITVILLVYRSYKNKLEAETRYRQSLEKEVSKRTLELSELNNKLLEASITDQLTGLFNRRYLTDIIEKKSSKIYRQFTKALERKQADSELGPRLLFLMFDLDGFKPINDNYGHDAGDKMIQQVANLLKNVCRINDIVIRWGGDEFLVIGEVSSRQEILDLAENIRASIEQEGFDIGLSQRMHLSSSIGFAAYPFSHHSPDSLSWEQAHMLADIALYRSKDAGRNAWTGILPQPESVPFTVMNTLVSNIESAIENGHVQVVSNKK
ncbi:two-component regulator propeller domain-containing protein [Glaciecola siphonariae]|uniref:Two-component regulator propeller domain-containing protein n=1 Tax=Glaciecola siphonariae TaxID=521012 RepID=A0ABV9LZD6_9ALTE